MSVEYCKAIQMLSDTKVKRESMVNWSFWGKVPSLSLWEACLLSKGVDPKVVTAWDATKIRDWVGGAGCKKMKKETFLEAKKQVDSIFELLELIGKNLVEAGGTLRSNGHIPPERFLGERFIGEMTVKADNFRVWADEFGLELHSSFPGTTEKPASAPDSFDIEHENWPDELDIALIAWRAVAFSSRDEQGTPKQRITQWLKGSGYGLSSQAIERIATVCNWKKEPGAPKKTHA